LGYIADNKHPVFFGISLQYLQFGKLEFIAVIINIGMFGTTEFC